MHRPRLNEAETRFLLRLLQSGKAEVQEKFNRMEYLKGEIYRLRRLIMKDAYAVVSEGYTAKKQELASLESQLLELLNYKTIYEGLIVKFDDLVSGRKNKSGRPKAITSLAKSYLTDVEP